MVIMMIPSVAERAFLAFQPRFHLPRAIWQIYQNIEIFQKYECFPPGHLANIEMSKISYLGHLANIEMAHLVVIQR